MTVQLTNTSSDRDVPTDGRSDMRSRTRAAWYGGAVFRALNHLVGPAGLGEPSASRRSSNRISA
jgi:hypothetical protein